MMRDGMASILLLSRQGGQSAAKILSNGCEEGLKLQKTNFLEDLFIEHDTDSSIKFKEKISKEFFNVFQSY